MNGSLIVTPYTGQTQPAQILVPATTFYRENWEESCWVMPPYQGIFPDVPNDQFPPPLVPVPALAFVPPPVGSTDLWRAMQTYPL